MFDPVLELLVLAGLVLPVVFASRVATARQRAAIRRLPGALWTGLDAVPAEQR